MTRDLAVLQHCTVNRLVLNCPYGDYPASIPVINQETHRKNGQHALNHLCLVIEPTILYFPLISAHHNLRLLSPLKTVLNRLGDTYQAYYNTYKTHAMATCHGGSGQPLDRDAIPNGKDTGIDILHDYHHEDTGDFENVVQENHTNLATLTRELDDLHQRVQAGEGQPAEVLYCIECKLQRLSIALHPSAPTEPLDDILKQYMDTLCSAQKQTNFTNTLLQDIPNFNSNDSTQLEDWLVDIETTANLSAESRTKLAQAKPEGLTCTLITEALTSGKCWDDIKDILHLKLCNTDIHTSVSHFMDIQQKEKESLAPYIHCFKGEAKRCNSTNSAATIRIFVKGFRNTHTIATRVYEKGPQTLADAISEAEKPSSSQTTNCNFATIINSKCYVP